MIEEFPPNADFNVTCRTPGCENQDVTILVTASVDNTLVMCGPCATLITDVVPVVIP